MATVWVLVAIVVLVALFVAVYNTRIQSFPTNLLAGGFGFGARDYFEADDTSRGPVAVQL